MEEAFLELLAGNRRHVESVTDQFTGKQASQQPAVVTVSCGDSRVLQDGMWDNVSPGRVFTHSCIGNRVTQQTDSGRVISGDVLFPLVYTGTSTAVVVGHTGCGAVTAAYEQLTDGREDPPGISYCIEQLTAVLESGVEMLPTGVDDDVAIQRLVEYNVDRQVELLIESPDVPDTVDVVGTVYDFHDIYSTDRGTIHVVNVDGVHERAQLKTAHPTIAEHIDRQWEYTRRRND